jgi:biopolymer transport protein ExbB
MLFSPDQKFSVRHSRIRAGIATLLCGISITRTSLPALAQDNIVATATLPRDLSPWGMFVNADSVVKAVLIGLAFASVLTWTVWLAKTIEIVICKRRVRAALNILVSVRSTSEGVDRFADT